MKTVINYMRPQSGTGANEIFGIDVAITNFLKAFFRYSRQETFFFLPGSDDSIDELKKIAASEQIDFARCAWIPALAPGENLRDVDLFFRPDPNLADHIWRRLQIPGQGYAFSSIVHTMSGERIAGVLGDFQTAPSRTGDSIVCPSTAIRDAVKRLWEIQAEYYNARFKGDFTCPVDLPVIPLGIHTERFLHITTPEKRRQQREQLGIADDEVVLLYVGRMSYATKAHPLPLFQAAELAARQTRKKVRLLMYGFFKPELMEQDFRAMAADYCSTVRVDFVLNNDPRFPEGMWAAGDIFASLIDNIQESFGFTPIEAMASGLPAVISDWDGYRDGVRNGVDGFHIPTMGVPAGTNLDIAWHYYNQRNYGDYLIRNNQSVAVDINMAAAAFTLLIEDAEQRRAMGASGRQRALEVYDWRTVIKAYEDMWEEQIAKRNSLAASHAPANWLAAHPGYPDPSAMFEGFPSALLRGGDRLQLLATDADVARTIRHTMNTFGIDMLLEQSVISHILGTLSAHAGLTIEEIRSALKITDQPRYMRSIAWLIKMGLVRKL